MSATVVVLSRRLGPVLPVAAVAALRAAARVVADDTVPPEVAAELGAAATGRPDVPATGSPDVPVVLLTTDPATPAAAGLLDEGATLLRTPEPAGAALLDAVAVMDRLRSPGGCPWDAEQTHASLMPFLIEETYELYQALEDGDRAALREELGDVLLQVLFHARLAAERDFDVDDVAADLVAKLVGRHPHVFAPSGPDTTERIDTAAAQLRRWEELKRAEKQRESAVDGVAFGQPAVALAAKLVSRARRAGVPADLLPGGDGLAGDGPAGDRPGERLFALAAAAKLAGADPEAELRAAACGFAAELRAAEHRARDAGEDPHALDAEGWRRFWPR